jgi:hypothetical protein
VTDHFLILYDTEEPWARNRAGVLEQTHDVYFKTFGKMGFRMWPLCRRQVCVLFADHKDYTAYARRVDQYEIGWSAGYYSVRTNRIVFFDERTSPQHRQLRDDIERLTKRLADVREQVLERSRAGEHSIAMDLRARAERIEKQLNWNRNRLSAMSKVGNVAKTVHEAVHLLAYNSGHQNPTVDYPFWFSEGLAVNFETDSPAKAFGPLHPNEWRKYTLIDAMADDKLLAIDDFVRLSKPPANDVEQIHALYDQAWVLYGFLFRYKRAELQQYVLDLHSGPPGVRTEQQHLASFDKAFGPIDRLEDQFQTYLKRIRASIPVSGTLK